MPRRGRAVRPLAACGVFQDVYPSPGQKNRFLAILKGRFFCGRLPERLRLSRLNHRNRKMFQTCGAATLSGFVVNHGIVKLLTTLPSP